LRLLGTLILLALVGFGGWYARGLHESPDRLHRLEDKVRQLFDNGVKRFEGALTKQNLEEAERALGDLKTIAAKDGRIAGMEARLLSAQVAKLLSDGNIDRAKELLDKAEKDGDVALDDIKVLREKLKAAQQNGAASASASSSSAPKAAARN
jgi:hypothetical protein